MVRPSLLILKTLLANTIIIPDVILKQSLTLVILTPLPIKLFLFLTKGQLPFRKLQDICSINSPVLMAERSSKYIFCCFSFLPNTIMEFIMLHVLFGSLYILVLIPTKSPRHSTGVT
eukprot:TRINITY_DN33058_c0_g1_i1.p1 TRINITY_DN33058_c0_g1~~TRINITY_DN33058_c0_g1_i1.p1  ORF type:complete len:117 (-),score=1.99 TRINITY_DN33058_c0_g1_i1:60-410(-)